MASKGYQKYLAVPRAVQRTDALGSVCPVAGHGSNDGSRRGQRHDGGCLWGLPKGTCEEA